MENGSNNQAVIDVVERLSAHQTIGTGAEHNDLALAILPDGKNIHDLQPYLDALRYAPKRIETVSPLTTVDSFVDYLKRFGNPDSAIFVRSDVAKPRLLGIVDYHGGGNETKGASEKADKGGVPTPRFGQHRATYDFPLSHQIKAWIDVGAKPLGSAAFAAFLEDHAFDIVNPPLDWMQADEAMVKRLTLLLNLFNDAGQVDDEAPDVTTQPEGEDDDDFRYIPRSALYKLRRIRFASVDRLMQLARKVEINVGAKHTSGYNNSTGARTLAFEEEHTAQAAGRKITIPDQFLLSVPVWEGETPQIIPVRLQYRIIEGKLNWFLTLIEWHRVVQSAVVAEAERVKEATGLPIFYGQPSLNTASDPAK